MNGLRLLACAALMGACASAPTPCAGVSGCARGEECLANRCVRPRAEPVESSAERLVLEPVALSVLGPSQAGNELPAVVTFGARYEGESLLLVRFVPRWRRGTRVRAAFLLLEPWPGTAPAMDDIPVEVWRVLSPWAARDVTWLDRPRLGYPKSLGLARSAPASVLRIDVTNLIEDLTNPGRPDHGLAVWSTARGPFGASFATGAAGGSVPRLEVYLDT